MKWLQFCHIHCDGFYGCHYASRGLLILINGITPLPDKTPCDKYGVIFDGELVHVCTVKPV